MKKEYCYVGIITDSGELRFLTSIDTQNKTWKYDTSEDPLVLHPSIARSLTEALFLNMVNAVTVRSLIPIKEHPGVRRTKLRDNLLTTIGRRAGNMEDIETISIGGSTFDEDHLAKFASHLADQWLTEDSENGVSFDQYIEEALITEYAEKPI